MRSIYSLVAVIALLAFSALTIGCGMHTPESGWHRGQITDVSVEGLFCKTLEAQIMTGNGNSSITYNFTLANQEVFNQLQAYQASSTPVNLHYNTTFIWSLCNSINGNFVDRVEPVGPHENASVDVTPTTSSLDE